MENIYTAYNFSHFAIYLPKLIKTGGNLTKFWQKQKCTVFLRHGVTYSQELVGSHVSQPHTIKQQINENNEPK